MIPFYKNTKDCLDMYQYINNRNILGMGIIDVLNFFLRALFYFYLKNSTASIIIVVKLKHI